MTGLDTIAAELAEEQASLDAVVAGLTPQQWRQPTPSPGWTVADQIDHLAYFDGTARQAIEDPGGFADHVAALLASEEDLDTLTLDRSQSAKALLARWRGNRRRLSDAVPSVEEGTRIPWYGPSMSPRSFLTARLMECWAHGTDVVDAVNGDRPATDRLRHIAQLGFLTRAWTYANRNEDVPPGDVRVEVDGPSGNRWVFGPDNALATVEGPAEDFCRVVTQRRHPDDTELRITGEIARDWMTKAQAYAGAPTDGPAARATPGS